MGLRAMRGSGRSTFEGKRLILRVCVLIPSAPMYFFCHRSWELAEGVGDVLLKQEIPDMRRVVPLESRRSTSASGGWFLTQAGGCCWSMFRVHRWCMGRLHGVELW